MRRSPNNPAFHDIVTLKIPPEGAPMRVIVTAEGFFRPLIDFFRTGRSFANSLGWQRKVAHSIGLLYDFTVAFPPPADEQALRRYLQHFIQTLDRGTIGEDFTDPRGLFWRPAPRAKVSEAAKHVITFTDYLAERYDQAPLIGTTPATLGERLALLRHFDSRENNAMLRHLRDRSRDLSRASAVRALHTRKRLSHSDGPPPAFPDSHFRILIEQGFGVSLESPEKAAPQRLRDAMVAIAQRAGGLRAHEVLHTLFSDVELDPRNGTARFAVAHPEEAVDSVELRLGEGARNLSRTEYLRLAYDRQPRNHLAGPEHLGWKGCVVDQAMGNRSFVYWVPSWWGIVFWRFHTAYRRQRPRGLKHPYLFIAHHADSHGSPYTLKRYHKNLAAAVERIGLRVAKEAGTTSHGFRHAYAQTLVALGMPPEDRKLAIRHSTLQSQEPYTRSTPSRVNGLITDLEPRLRELDAGLMMVPFETLLPGGRAS